MRTVNPQKVEIRKSQILDAARHCFEQKGFHATSMAEICARAQISPGALYRYFASKEAIIDAMCNEEQFRSLNVVLNLCNNIKSGDDFNQAMRFVVSDVVDKYCTREHGAMAAELIAEAMRNPAFAENAAKSYQSYHDALSGLFKIGQEIGEIAPDIDIDEATSMFMAVVDGLVLRIAFCDDLDRENIKKWILNMGMRYLRNPNSKDDKISLHILRQG